MTIDPLATSPSVSEMVADTNNISVSGLVNLDKKRRTLDLFSPVATLFGP